MAAWSDVGVATIGGALGIAGTLCGTIVQSKLGAFQRREERVADAHAARVDRIARVLGPIQTLLIDLLPARATMSGSFSDRAAVYAQRQERWFPLRDQLEVVLVMEPDADIRHAMRHLEVAVENVYHRLGLVVSPTGGDRDWYDEAVENHDEAVRRAEEIMADLHRAQGNGRATRPTEIGREVAAPSEAEDAE